MTNRRNVNGLEEYIHNKRKAHNRKVSVEAGRQSKKALKTQKGAILAAAYVCMRRHRWTMLHLKVL